jgi:hypothetical protein
MKEKKKRHDTNCFIYGCVEYDENYVGHEDWEKLIPMSGFLLANWLSYLWS